MVKFLRLLNMHLMLSMAQAYLQRREAAKMFLGITWMKKVNGIVQMVSGHNRLCGLHYKKIENEY